MYREHDPNQGRWTQPDPTGLAAADPSNPQSWNRYSYVLNSPMNFIDPLGLHCRLPGGEVVDDDFEECESEGGTWTNDPLTGGSPLGVGGFGSGFDFGGFGDLGFLSVASLNSGLGPDLPVFFMTVEVWGTNVFDTTGINGQPGGGGSGGWQPPVLDPIQLGKSVLGTYKSLLLDAATQAACKNSPQDAFIKSVKGATLRNAAWGALIGFGLGEAFPAGGGIPGAVVGGLGGAAKGALSGTATGSIRAAACYTNGAYGPQSPPDHLE